jgi:hypothetical protein
MLATGEVVSDTTQEGEPTERAVQSQITLPTGRSAPQKDVVGIAVRLYFETID